MIGIGVGHEGGELLFENLNALRKKFNGGIVVGRHIVIIIVYNNERRDHIQFFLKVTK
tara:strand:- start:166 stop:339 length:174 start_codon:yes stop_codon:yes gene_type:complete